MGRTNVDTEISERFLKLMRNHMEFSYAKYGPIRDAYPHKVNAIESLQKRLKMYAETGNTEYLVDAANFAMIEFMLPAHPEAHFKGTDQSGSPGRVWHGSTRSTHKVNSE